MVVKRDDPTAKEEEKTESICTLQVEYFRSQAITTRHMSRPNLAASQWRKGEMRGF